MLAGAARGFYVVAETQQDQRPGLVGQLMVTYEWSDWRNGTFWWIQSVYVAPPWRRRGVYRSLHEYLLRETRARPDVCGVRLYVEADNAAAQTVYERVGLVPSSYRVFEHDFVLSGRARKRPTRSRRRPRGGKR